MAAPDRRKRRLTSLKSRAGSLPSLQAAISTAGWQLASLKPAAKMSGCTNSAQRAAPNLEVEEPHMIKPAGGGRDLHVQHINHEGRGLETLAKVAGLDNALTVNISFNKLTELEGWHGSKLRELQAGNNSIARLSSLPALSRLQVRHVAVNTACSAIACAARCCVLQACASNANTCTDLLLQTQMPSCNTQSWCINQRVGICLQVLDLAANKLTSLQDLAGLINLKDLNVAFNHVSSLTSLPCLPALTTLNVSQNRLSSLAGLRTCTALLELSANANKLVTLSSLATCHGLTELQV
jgi:internalin A